MDKKKNQHDEYLSQQQLQSVPPGGLVWPRSLVDAAIARGKNVEPDPEAAQFIAVDPGYGKRAAMLKIQERVGDRVDLWGEESFTQRDDDYVAAAVVAHCREWKVQEIYVDAEDPGLAAAMVRDLDAAGLPALVVTVPFAKYKRLSVKATRWLLRSGTRVAWKADETLVHRPGYRRLEPSLFKTEVRDYALKPGEDEVPAKGADHGPDAWTAYVAGRWVEAWLEATGEAA